MFWFFIFIKNHILLPVRIIPMYYDIHDGRSYCSLRKWWASFNISDALAKSHCFQSSLLHIQRRIQGEGWGGCNPPFGKFSNLSGYPCLSLFHAKNDIISYNVSSSQIDHYKKTVATPLLDPFKSAKCNFDFLTKIATPAICFVPCHRL